MAGRYKWFGIWSWNGAVVFFCECLSLSSQLVTRQQWCWWGSIKIQMSWQEISEQLYSDAWAKMETVMLRVTHVALCRIAGCLMFWNAIKFGQVLVHNIQRGSHIDRRLIGLTSSSLLMMKRKRGLPNLKWQTAALHKSPLCSSEISDCLQAMVYQRRGVTHGSAGACHWGDSHWSMLQKSDHRRPNLRGGIMWSRKAKRFITFPPHFAKQTYRGDNANRW